MPIEMPPTVHSSPRNGAHSAIVRYPWAMVPPNGPAFAASTSTWIHWWSPVASANPSIRPWSIVVHSVAPRSVPAAAVSAASESNCIAAVWQNHPRGPGVVAGTVDRMARHLAPGGILGGPVDGPERLAAEYPAVAAVEGTLVLHRASGFAGRIVGFDPQPTPSAGAQVRLLGSTGLEKTFAVRPGDLAVDGRPVPLVPPAAARSDADGPDLRGGTVRADARTASGSRMVEGAKARTARASRILVEGKHDAELIEKVWGDDLRVEGVVVELLDGVDHLEDAVRSFAPGKGRRLGVLVDHLVPGSKEARVAAAVRDPNVLVLGTPFVDIWAAIRPKTAGIDGWPDIPMGTPWKEGVCAALGVADPPGFWHQLLAAVQNWGDLDQTLVASMEQLIDFVTAP